MLTSICVEMAYRTCETLSHVRRARVLNYPLRILGELRDSQIVLAPCEWPLGRQLGVKFRLSSFCFHLGNWLVTSRRRNHGSRRMVTDMKRRMKELRSWQIPQIFFSFLFVARCFPSLPWFRRHLICVDICVNVYKWYFMCNRYIMVGSQGCSSESYRDVDIVFS